MDCLTSPTAKRSSPRETAAMSASCRSEDVLVLVDEHVVILPADAVSHLLAREGAQGAALEVGVGKAAALFLAAGVGFADAPGGFRQREENAVELQRIFLACASESSLRRQRTLR